MNVAFRFALMTFCTLFMSANAFAQSYQVGGMGHPYPGQMMSQEVPIVQPEQMPQPGEHPPVVQPPAVSGPVDQAAPAPMIYSGQSGCNTGCDSSGYFQNGYSHNGYAQNGCGCDSGYSQGCNQGCGQGGCGLGGGLGCGIGGGFGCAPSFGAFNSCYQSGCGPKERFYLSVDYGISISSDSASHIGNTANRFGGTPTYGFDDAQVGRLGIGKYLKPNLRFEIEGSYRSHELSGFARGTGQRSQDTFAVLGSRDTSGLMFNLLRDFGGGGKFTPYLKAGAGLTFNQTGADYGINVRSPAIIRQLGLPGNTNFTGGFPQDDEWEFAWGVGGGVGVRLKKDLVLDVEYLYTDLGVAATGYDMNGDAISFGDGFGHEFTLGLRWEF